MTDIPIPPCYRRPFKRWLQEEYRTAFDIIAPSTKRRPTEGEINKLMRQVGVHVAPVVSQTHIVFAVCTDEDGTMIRAIKIPRAYGVDDANFVMRILAIATK